MSILVLCWALLFGSPQPQSAATPMLDYQFFKEKVQPVFLARRVGHARCVACHGGTTSQVLHLQPLSPGATSWNEEQSQKNFEAAKKVVVPGNPKSPLLMHPLAEEAGGDFFHNGGKHFFSQSDPEWQALKDWVMGQTLTAGK